MANDDVLERASVIQRRCGVGIYPADTWEAREVIDALVTELRASRARVAAEEKAPHMALRLARTRGDRLDAIRDCLKQNKGDDLVRVEVEWLLECHYKELDAAMAGEPEPLCLDCGSATFDGGRCRYDSINHRGAAMAGEDGREKEN